VHVDVAAKRTLPRHAELARHAAQHAAGDVACTVAMNFVVFISIFATVSQPLPSEAAADSVQIAEEALPLSGKFGLDPTTGWSLRPVVNGTLVE
jgi:hypothetical protein